MHAKMEHDSVKLNLG